MSPTTHVVSLFLGWSNLPRVSAASLYYTLNLHAAYPGQVRRERKRDEVRAFVMPSEESQATFATKGMARRLGTQTKQSWALSHVHIAYLNAHFHQAYDAASGNTYCHEIACAAAANLLGYLGWLRGGELFGILSAELEAIQPHDVELHGLPPYIGAITRNILMETKTNPCEVADIVMAYETLSGLDLGYWVMELKKYPPAYGGLLFSTAHNPHWTSQYFRTMYAWPLLEEMRTIALEPSLQLFGDAKGTRIQDKVYSIHSWRRAGRSKCSRAARHNEPQPKGTRQATDTEVYEHGRWVRQGANATEDMAATYNQWSLVERLAITMLCM
jgi:hypothetical protein